MSVALDKDPSTGEGSRRNNPFSDSQIAKEPPEQAWTGDGVAHVPLTGTLTTQGRTAFVGKPGVPQRGACGGAFGPLSQAWACTSSSTRGPVVVFHVHALPKCPCCGSLCLTTTNQGVGWSQGPRGRR